MKKYRSVYVTRWSNYQAVKIDKWNDAWCNNKMMRRVYSNNQDCNNANKNKHELIEVLINWYIKKISKYWYFTRIDKIDTWKHDASKQYK